MISLKKYLEQEPDKLLSCALDSYRSALDAVGAYGTLSCPATGSNLRQNLAGIAERISGEATCSVMKETREQVQEQLRQWGSRTEEYHKQKTNEVKELLILLARTAESVGERDQKYASQFTQLTSRLQTIGDLEDITQIRTSLVQSATELRTCVGQMTHEGQQSVSKLQAEMSTYQAELAGGGIACLPGWAHRPRQPLQRGVADPAAHILASEVLPSHARSKWLQEGQ